jgi:hypothetical protein
VPKRQRPSRCCIALPVVRPYQEPALGGAGYQLVECRIGPDALSRPGACKGIPSWVNPRGLGTCDLIEAASAPYDLHGAMGRNPQNRTKAALRSDCDRDDQGYASETTERSSILITQQRGQHWPSQGVGAGQRQFRANRPREVALK